MTATPKMDYTREQLIDALQREYEYLIHDDYEPFEDMTAEEHFEWLHTLSDEDLIEETCTDETYSLKEYMNHWG